MPEKLKFGIVGAGAVAYSYVRAFEQCADAEIAAISDIRVEAADAIAQGIRCRSYGRFERMVQECDLDAAIVCTPPSTHPEICIHLIECGIPVLCEKPFSINEQRAQEMLDAAQKSGVILTMASKFRYVDDIVRAKSMATSGVLGDLIALENTFATRVEMALRWNSRAEISGGGVLIDNGTHSVDLMHYFLGPAADVQVLEGRRTQGLAVEETVAVCMRSFGGVIFRSDLSWSMNKGTDSFLDIYGVRGAISVGWKMSKYLDYSHGEWVEFGHGYNKLKAFCSQIENFARALRGEEMLSITGADAIASVRTIEAAYEALRKNQQNSPINPSIRPEIEKAYPMTRSLL